MTCVTWHITYAGFLVVSLWYTQSFKYQVIKKLGRNACHENGKTQQKQMNQLAVHILQNVIMQWGYVLHLRPCYCNETISIHILNVLTPITWSQKISQSKFFDEVSNFFNTTQNRWCQKVLKACFVQSSETALSKFTQILFPKISCSGFHVRVFWNAAVISFQILRKKYSFGATGQFFLKKLVYWNFQGYLFLSNWQWQGLQRCMGQWTAGTGRPLPPPAS